MVVETTPVVKAQKIALDARSGLDMTALTKLVTYDWPKLTGEGGCSLTCFDGTTQLIAGRVPATA